MVVEEILEELSEDKVNELVAEINEAELSKELRRWVNDYEKYGGDRDMFLWKWLYIVNKDWYYSPIQDKYKTSLTKVKELYNMFIVLLDDVAEEKGKEELLESLYKIPTNEVEEGGLSNKKEKEYLNFTERVWKEIVGEIKSYPHYKEFEDVFYFDTAQFLNAVRYAKLIFDKPHFLNEKELWMYLPHSMQILIDFDLDLMCLEEFDKNELGRAREIVLNLQEMGRIGNWLSTWEREVEKDDFTSLVVAHALSNDTVNLETLNDSKTSAIESINDSPSKDFLLQEWEKRYHELEDVRETGLIDSKRIQEKAKYLLRMHLISTGLK